MSVIKAFARFPKQAEIIGRLLAGFADIEIALMHCVQVVRDGDLDTVLKAMFRTVGESSRIQVADAFGRHHYTALGLETEFSMAISAVKYSWRIRSQYAHCLWYDDNTGQLAFTNLEEIAKENAFLKDLRSLTIMHVDVPFLHDQELFFNYTEYLLVWVNFEGRTRSGELKQNPTQKPKSLRQPELHLP